MQTLAYSAVEWPRSTTGAANMSSNRIRSSVSAGVILSKENNNPFLR